jgi:RNA polymerase sigma factor (sigma-70 family)
VIDALTDDALRARAREPELFSIVYRTYAAQVLGYLKARGVEDPEAVMQEVFLAVLPRLETVTGGVAGLRTFVFSVAHARMVDDHRRRTRAPLELPFQPDLDRREESSAEDEVMERIGPQEIQDLLIVLPDEQREVLTLRLVAGLTIEQSAEVMGKSNGAIKQLQRRAGVAAAGSAPKLHASTSIQQMLQDWAPAWTIAGSLAAGVAGTDSSLERGSSEPGAANPAAPADRGQPHPGRTGLEPAANQTAAPHTAGQGSAGPAAGMPGNAGPDTTGRSGRATR